MKKQFNTAVLVAILGLGLVAFTNAPDPEITIRIKTSQGQFIDNSLTNIKTLLSNSDLPSKQTTAIFMALDSVQRILVKGIQQPKVEPIKVDTDKSKKPIKD